ncbi:GntR family transcriptional regulator [Kribbella antibiotica]|uniref:GntR family transcriptional regulator n=1 Tax=Kribbella antibiotica TaxID=190195 RepID=A0A4R4YE09_9ACTN|nr:GntR family transcriptional regulator [Kribbella antibiotica]TDD42961.1 GntR family transcriptional regulator [Kribbella antibiotica]
MPEGLKHERVAAVLTREIKAGLVRRGARLPGEVDLASRFGVSRNTVRAALAQLTEDGLISTRSGKGSFVIFDGRPLDGRLGWTHTATDPDLQVELRTIRIAHEHTSHKSDRTEKLIVIERLQLAADKPIAWECSWIPALDSLRELPRRGLVDDSIALTLTRAGLHPDHCQQRLRGRSLESSEAKLLKRRTGSWFLHTERTSWTADDRFAEYAECLLDPSYFELTLDYGTP